MGLLSKLNPFKTKSTEVVDSQSLAELLLGLGLSDAGIEITDKNALQLSTVYSCIRVLCESVGMLPLNLNEVSGGKRTKAKNHPAQKLFTNGPNDYMTPMEFKELILTHLCLRGNHYSYINWVAGKPAELLPLNPANVEPKLKDDWSVQYKVTFPNGKWDYIDAKNILHIRLQTLDGLVGMSPIQQGRHALGLAKATERHGAKVFANGAHPSGGFTTENGLTDPQFERLKLQLEDYKGENVHKNLILEGGLKWFQTSMTSEDAQYLETRKFQRSEICGMFRVPPHMIADLERATFSNIEHLGISFVQTNLMPYLVRIEERLLKSLITSTTKEYQVKFNANALMRGDSKSRAEFYTKMIQNGAMSPNEIRSLEDMNPRTGGDIFLTPMNMAINGKPVEADSNATSEETGSGEK